MAQPLLSPINDYVFKRVFGENLTVLADLQKSISLRYRSDVATAQKSATGWNSLQPVRRSSLCSLCKMIPPWNRPGESSSI